MADALTDIEVVDLGGKEWYKCLKCNKLFTTKRRILGHTQSKHKEYSPRRNGLEKYHAKSMCYTVVSNSAKAGKQFICLVCKKVLSSKQRILLHLHKVHEKTPVKRVKKKYLEDETIPIPDRTLSRWEKHKKEKARLSLNTLYESDLQIKVEGHPGELDTHSGLNSALGLGESIINEIPDSSMVTNGRKSSSDTPEYAVSLVSTTEKQVSTLADSQCFLPSRELSPNRMDVSPDFGMQSSPVTDTSSICESSSDVGSLDSDSCLSDSGESLSSEHDSINLDGNTETDTDEADDRDIPVKEFQSLSLLSCFSRNNFSASTSKDVIETLKTTFKNCEDISSLSWTEIMSYVDTTPVKEVHYCVLCKKVFPEDCNIFHCGTANCDGLRYKGPLSSQQIKTRQPKQCFVFADVKKQLVDLLQTPGNWEDIQDCKMNAYKRLETGSSDITDITDGAGYRRMMKEGCFLDKNTHNITGVFNTDGVNLYSSSKVELWPIFLAVNELRPSKRFARDNILLVGIWQGKGKPPFKEFFENFCEEMNYLYTDGVNINIVNKRNVLNVKLAVLGGIFDLPAKAEVLNMSYFNGAYSCIKCEEPGVTVRQGKGTARCFPYRNQGTRYPDRNQNTVLANMRIGNEKNRSKGFKGESGLMNLEGYDLVLGTVPDYMHGVLLGITKTLLNKWFSPSQSNQEYFIGKHLKTISNRLKNIKPPDKIERLPRDLEKHYSHFKATELQSWLLFYSYPCLLGILDEEYLENLVCLSEGIHILLRNNITQDLLRAAMDLLDQFYSSFYRLYGEGSCGLNVHNTGLHLVEYVKLWGPIWAWSCFPFEDSNAMILQAVHGTGLVLNQVMKYRQTQACIRKRGLEKKKRGSWKVTLQANNCNISGAVKSINMDQTGFEVLNLLRTLTVHENLGNLKKLDRIIVNEKRYYSEQYCRMQKRVCCVVLFGFESESIGSVKHFILCNGTVYAVIEKLDKIPLTQLQIRVASHFVPVKYTNTLTLVNVEQLREILVLIPVLDTNACLFVVRMPNDFGHAVFK